MQGIAGKEAHIYLRKYHEHRLRVLPWELVHVDVDDMENGGG